MESMKNLGVMRAVLCLEGNGCHPNKITKQLELPPTAKWYGDDVYPAWVWSTMPKKYIRTNEPLLELVEQFSDKVTTICNICKVMELNAHIKVLVSPLGGDLPDPELSIESPAIIFANAISSDIEVIIENWPDNID